MRGGYTPSPELFTMALRDQGLSSTPIPLGENELKVNPAMNDTQRMSITCFTIFISKMVRNGYQACSIPDLFTQEI